MSAMSFRQLLAVLHDNEPEARAVFERAVELADVERARLTLAKTTDPGRLVRWWAPLAPIQPPEPLFGSERAGASCQQLMRLAEIVPRSIPIRTVELVENTTRALRRMLAEGSYDLLVIGATALAHDFRLRRALRRDRISILLVRAEWPGVSEPLSLVAPEGARVAVGA